MEPIDVEKFRALAVAVEHDYERKRAGIELLRESGHSEAQALLLVSQQLSTLTSFMAALVVTAADALVELRRIRPQAKPSDGGTA